MTESGTRVSPRILVVDDEPSLVQGLSYALERDGFEVEVARDGETAVSSALNRAVDLVLLDLMLPGISGSEACRRIRAESAVPIIMLTAKDSERDLLEGLHTGADDYVTKPYSAQELIARIRALLRRRELDRSATRETLRAAGLVIDPVAATAEIDGRTVPLTPSEIRVLSLLAGSPGTVFTRRQIMERLWGSTHVGDTHTCEVHISSLRRKLERSPAEPALLVTVRGVGYKLVSDPQRL